MQELGRLPTKEELASEIPLTLKAQMVGKGLASDRGAWASLVKEGKRNASE